MTRLIRILIAAATAVMITCAFGETPTRAEDEPPVVSVKATLGSLAQNGAGNGLLEEYDKVHEIVADTDAVFEEKYGKMTYKKNGFTKKELKLVASLIYCEANSMCFEAKVAVANVVLNRMNNTDPNVWGHCNTIYDVIYDRRWGVQFSPTAGDPSSMDKAMALYSGLDSAKYENWQIRAMNSCIEAAKAALAGYKAVPDTFMYFNSHLVASREKCQNQGRPFAIIERHIYYK
ncbi:MAG: cell wall hydrolase [Lachnospiraceae bacterium]|nr:cell wall hydrolase [Lachnospiraceae bacterium]